MFICLRNWGHMMLMSSPPSDSNHHHAAKSKVRLTPPFIHAAQHRREFSGSSWAEKVPLNQQKNALFFPPDALTFCSDFVKLRLWKHFFFVGDIAFDAERVFCAPFTVNDG